MHAELLFNDHLQGLSQWLLAHEDRQLLAVGHKFPWFGAEWRSKFRGTQCCHFVSIDRQNSIARQNHRHLALRLTIRPNPHILAAIFSQRKLHRLLRCISLFIDYLSWGAFPRVSLPLSAINEHQRHSLTTSANVSLSFTRACYFAIPERTLGGRCYPSLFVPQLQ